MDGAFRRGIRAAAVIAGSGADDDGHSCLVLKSADEALMSFPLGRLELATCEGRGSITTAAFDLPMGDRGHTHIPVSAGHPLHTYAG